MSAPVVVDVATDSPAAGAGVVAGDLILSINEQVPRDVIQYQLLVDDPLVTLDIERNGLLQAFTILKIAGVSWGVVEYCPLLFP